ncbi:MAG: DNA alkylation repair protein [Bacilli bacterium]
MSIIDLENELRSYSDIERGAFNESLFSCDLKSLGTRVPQLRLLAHKYSDLDISTIPLDSTFDENFLFFSIGLLQNSTLEKQTDFILKYQDYLKTWAITDSISQLFRIKDFQTDLTLLNKLKSGSLFAQRLSYVLILRYLRLKKSPLDNIISFLEDSPSREVYYALAWVLAEFCIKYPEAFVSLYQKERYSLATRRITVSKINDSRRVTAEGKKKAKKLILGN